MENKFKENLKPIVSDAPYTFDDKTSSDMSDTKLFLLKNDPQPLEERYWYISRVYGFLCSATNQKIFTFLIVISFIYMHFVYYLLD